MPARNHLTAQRGGVCGSVLAPRLLSTVDMKREQEKAIDGWQIRSRFDWLFTAASFVTFLALEAAILYAYFHWLNRTIK